MVNSSNNINKTKEHLNSDGQHFQQHQQNKRTFKQRWSTVPTTTTTKQNNIEKAMVNSSNNINKTTSMLNSCSIHLHICLALLSFYISDIFHSCTCLILVIIKTD